MTNLFLRKALGVTTIFAMFLAFVPFSASAAWLGAPSNLVLVGGIYTNDTTPTATWTRPADATWYQVLVDDGNWIDLSNVSSYTIASLPNGWHTFYVRAMNSTSTSVSASVTFEIDTVGPTVPAVSPSTAIEDQSVTFSTTPSGEAATTSCSLYVSGSSVGSMTKNGSTFSKSYTFANDGSYTVYARCVDGDGNSTTGTSRTVTVSNVDVVDTFAVPSVSPSLAYEDESMTFSVTPYGTLDAIACHLYVSGSYAGSMSQSSNTFTKNYTFTNDGSYTVYASCENENGGWVNGTSRTVSVVNQEDPDNTPTFIVPLVLPSTAIEDTSTTFSVTPYGTLDAVACNLYVSGSSVGSMNGSSSNRFTKNYTFSNDGSYTVYAYCEDENGDWTRGASRTVRVSNQPTSYNGARYGSLIKIPCGVYAYTSETCKAVYYYGNDGKRHVFPNESVFFTWYNNFDDVVEVSQDFMSSLTIGKNVTYRPGSVVVKFDSSSKVYAIQADHTLRHYTTLSLLKSDYGSYWTNVLAKVPDSLYSNYTIGSVIDSTSDYDRDDAYYSVNDIDDVL